MAKITRRIGLSLGADTCWPICFEELVKDLDLQLALGNDSVSFEIERVTIEPFDLRQPARYDLVIDRLTHWYHVSREWIKKATILNGVYVFNNPWSVQANEKHTTYCAMIRLGLPIPETWLVPPKSYEEKPDLQTTLVRYAKLFDLGQVGASVGYPMFMKPFDGGGWVGVSKVDDESALREAYEKSGKLIMHLQKGVLPHEHFCRCIGLGPQTKVIRYDPSAPLHQRYLNDKDYLPNETLDVLRDITLTINAFFNWDFNSCEALYEKGEWYPIDFANPCPDSQVTSLHRHFPWLVKSKLRWALYVAATKKRLRINQDWQPFFDIADKDLPYREKLTQYAKLACERMEAERFEEFCAKHLAHLDEVAWNFFGSERAKTAVRKKVEALFPKHEWDAFTEHFWNELQVWRQEDAAERAALAAAPKAAKKKPASSKK
ncbi:MAG: hypothetical protein IT454_08365 [Planctomycetes bacterium]|nr:hypothetical protein [Planctomycetota bacterium]